MGVPWVAYGSPMGHPWFAALCWPPPKSEVIYSTRQWISYSFAPYLLPVPMSRLNDPGFQEYLRQRQEERDYQAYLTQQAVSATQPAPSTSQPAAPASQQPMAASTPETVPRPARVTQSYTSARALPPPQNQVMVAPSSYAPFLGASTLAPSSSSLSTNHVNQARLTSSSRTTLPRRVSQRPAGRPLGSTSREAPTVASEFGPRIDSCVFLGPDRERMFRLSVQVYPPMLEDTRMTPVVFHALKTDWTNMLEFHNLLFTYELSAATPVQELLQHVLTDLRRRGCSFPPIHHFGDTTGSPISHVQLLALVNKGKANHNQIKLTPVVKDWEHTIDHLAADKNHFAAPDLCIEKAPNRASRFVIRIMPMVSPLFFYDGRIKHSCVSEVVYSRFPRDGGSLRPPRPAGCDCEEGELVGEEDLGDEGMTRQILLGVGSSTTSSSQQPDISSATVSRTAFALSSPRSPRSVLQPVDASPSAPRLGLRSLTRTAASTSLQSSSMSSTPSGIIPGEIWNENCVFIQERNTDSIFDIETFADSVYGAASVGGTAPPLEIRGVDVNDAARLMKEVIVKCGEDGDYGHVLVKAHQRLFSLQYPHSASGPGVEREVLWTLYSSFDLETLLMPREDGFHTIRPLFTSPDIPVPASRLEQLRCLGAVTALLLISGQWPAPFDPAIFQFLTHGANLHSLHPTFVGEWHPRLRRLLLDLIELGPNDSLAPFESDLVNYLDTNASHYRERDLATHQALPPLILYTATLGPASFKRPEWIAFHDGFELKCPRSGFTFPRMVKLFNGGSEAFLSVLASSYISDADVFLSAARFLTPNNTTLWTMSLRAHTGEASLTFQDVFERFLCGSGIPCLDKFEGARGSFPTIVDLSRMDKPGWRGQMVAWAATGSPFVDLAADMIEIGPIATNDPMYASQESELYASAGTICFRTCTRSMRYPVDYLLRLAAAEYDEDSEPASFQEAYDFWVLRECLLTIGRHSMA
ncbi:hypothetical protein MVEN_00790500 [Mycena venus]|uniref:HECT domain-containing protein n=1 Tax=Mycena venus TaxID=2733690 RepID=A0A8H6YLT2_9AGAR|nr:hypothetical protein MVEN_00790500 [Mycena venus]